MILRYFKEPSLAKPPRRALCASFVGAYLSGTGAQAQSPIDTPLAYRRFTQEGPAGRPKESVLFEERGLRLRLQIWLPQQAMRPNIVIFSHGEFGVPIGYDGLLGHLASHGYAVVAPHHEDVRVRSAWIGAVEERGNRLLDIPAWNGRLLEIDKTLDVLPLVEKATGYVFARERVIVIGHSLGAFTAGLALGMRVLSQSGQVFERRNYRLYGGVFLSPQGRGKLGLSDGAWDNLAAPSLFVTGPGDQDIFGASAEAKSEPFFLAPPGYRHLMWAREILPNLFTGQRQPRGSRQEAITQDIKAVITAFLAAYVGRDEEILRQLAGDYWTRMSDGRFSSRYR